MCMSFWLNLVQLDESENSRRIDVNHSACGAALLMNDSTNLPPFAVEHLLVSHQYSRDRFESLVSPGWWWWSCWLFRLLLAVVVSPGWSHVRRMNGGDSWGETNEIIIVIPNLLNYSEKNCAETTEPEKFTTTVLRALAFWKNASVLKKTFQRNSHGGFRTGSRYLTDSASSVFTLYCIIVTHLQFLHLPCRRYHVRRPVTKIGPS